MKLTKKLAATTVGVAALAVTSFGFISPTSATPTGRTDARWNPTCSVVVATSTKDISNVVYTMDGVEHRIEYTDGTNSVTLPGEIDDLWIKAGSNKSGHGSGFGEHFARPEHCTVTITAH